MRSLLQRTDIKSKSKFFNYDFFANISHIDCGENRDREASRPTIIQIFQFSPTISAEVL